MAADRYQRGNRVDPGAMAAALGVTTLFLFGLSLTAPHFVRVPDPVLRLTRVTPDPVPPPKEPPKPQPKRPLEKTIDAARPDRIDLTKSPVDPLPAAGDSRVDVMPNPGPSVGEGSGGDFVVPPLPPHVPVEIGAQLDGRYASSFQPDYPLGEKQAEHEGRVVVRVLVGIDGRVKAVEPVASPSAAFFEATRRRALERWRFRPATRDGVAVETWKTVGVSFRLETE